MSCIRANVNITIVEGGTFNKVFQWKTGTPLTPVDLTDYTARMQVRAKVKDEDPLLDVIFKETTWEADADTGIYLAQTADPDDNGKFRVYLKDDDTKGLCASHKDISGFYDLFLYNADEEAVFQMYGSASIIASVTRDV
jgi:hypothetical protein